MGNFNHTFEADSIVVHRLPVDDCFPHSSLWVGEVERILCD